MPCASRIVNIISISTAMARNIDDCARDALLAEIVSYTYKVGLNPAVRRRVGAKLEHPHGYRLDQEVTHGDLSGLFETGRFQHREAAECRPGAVSYSYLGISAFPETLEESL